VAGLIARGALTRARPFRGPHHSASMAALTGGGLRVRPGEVSLAHNGVLFLDELPEFSPQALDSLRQPLETGEVTVARANAHVRYPARVQLVAAMNPCRCGVGGLGRGACGKAPRCQQSYQGRVSGPLLDRIDLTVEVPPVTAADLALPPPAEGTAEVAARVAAARAIQVRRAEAAARGGGALAGSLSAAPLNAAPLNARAEGAWLDHIAALDAPARALMARAAEARSLTARGWTRTLRLARTIADLEGEGPVRRVHVAEALIYRRAGPAGEGVGATAAVQGL
jgi:magnesium chelatase family protein